TGPSLFSSLQHKFKAPSRAPTAKPSEHIFTSNKDCRSNTSAQTVCFALALCGALNFCDGEEKGRGPV
ncbi:hypothetical protein, partial [Ralstonia solanacearum]|uniref:hypothetical protein n=1 Tax=Ralstonia solanacearum TaxID=305 RepID=UPI001E2DCAE8